MGKINWARVILGGLIAGVVINTGEFILNAAVVSKDWQDTWAALGKDTAAMAASLPIWILWSFIAGVCGVWLYAAIRPRFGAGPRTAAIAGVGLWVFAWVTFTLSMLGMDLLPDRLIWIPLFWGLPEAVLAVMAGAWMYKEA